jgi:hypothetical protein
MEFVESSLNQYNNADISYFLWICFQSVLITDKEPCKLAVNKRQIQIIRFYLVRSVAYVKSEVKLFACKEIINRW